MSSMMWLDMGVASVLWNGVDQKGKVLTCVLQSTSDT